MVHLAQYEVIIYTTWGSRHEPTGCAAAAEAQTAGLAPERCDRGRLRQFLKQGGKRRCPAVPQQPQAMGGSSEAQPQATCWVITWSWKQPSTLSSLTDQCLTYLDQLPPSSLTEFLRQLTTSATALSVPVPDPPPDPSLEYLTALVHLHRGEAQAAEAVLLSTLARARSAPWRIFHLSLLCQIYERLGEPAKQRQALAELKDGLAQLNHAELLRTLPEPHLLSGLELDLLKLSALLQCAQRSDN